MTISFRLLVGGLLLCVLRSISAQEANPAFWLLMPYAGMVSTCANLDEDVRSRLRSALSAAEASSAKMLPAFAWEIVKQGLGEKSTGKSEAASRPACEEFISALSSPSFPTYFRHQIAGQSVVPLALTCLIKHPSAVPNMKTDWVAAFNRQGFSISLAEVTKFLDEARSPGSDLSNAATLPLSESDCFDLGKSLFGKNFDEQYGEAGIQKLFSRR